MPLPRFRLRTLMLAVAVVAVALGGWSIWERAGRYNRLGWQHQNAKNTLAADPPTFTDPGRRRQRWHAELAAKYFRAARYPWLPVEPDPPPPE